MVSSSKGEESKGLEHSDGGKAAGKMPSLNRTLPATGMPGVAPESDGGVLSDVKDFRQPTPMGTQKAKSSASLQEKTLAAPILSKTPLDPSRMGRLSPANAETDRLLELLSALVHPQAQAEQGQTSSFTPPLLQTSAQASKPNPSPQASGQANPMDGKDRVKMFAGLLDELYGSKSSAEKFQAVLESRFSDRHAWLNLKETPEFAFKIQAENALEGRQKAMPLLQSKDKQDANISFQEAMALSRSFRPNNADAQEVTRQLQEAILGHLSQDRPAIQQRHTIVLALEPPDLGELAVRLDLKGNDLKVSIVATSHEAGQALKQGQAGLQHNLREQGLDLTQFSLSIGNQGSFSREFEGFSGQPSTPPHTVNLSNGQEATSSNAILPVLPYHKGMLSIRV
jgi:flagellar hook-length control protein FliK